MSSETSQASRSDSLKRFGAFSGVFTPSILTILGVIMYMRFGWVVGNAGLAGTLIIVMVSHLISLTTGLSVSSIATNRKVGTGGAYFMISRTLGAPAGASIGIPLFLGQALSVTFYIVGFSESLTEIHGLREAMPWLNQRVIGTVTLVLLTLVSMRSADLAIKAQYVVMAAIGISLIAMFIGKGQNPPDKIQWWNPHGAPMTEVFSVFFPAVTGIMAGVSMSGDLKNPREALPKGTLWAIFVGFLIYMALPVWFSYHASTFALTNDKHIAWKLALVPQLVYVGVWGATLSSAIGSILSAPRTLQALALDGIVPRTLSRGSGPANEPRLGILCTFVLAEVGILMGSLDVIAPILTMFFLATYGVTNLACGLERWAASPSFRPTFKVPALLSIAGALGCFYVMSVLNMLAAIAAVVLCTAIFIWVERRELDATYGDARHGIYAAVVRTVVQRLRRVPFHPMNWRPNLIIFGGDMRRRRQLLTLGSAMVQDRGMVTFFNFLRGNVGGLVGERQRHLGELEAFLADEFPNVFARVDITSDLHRGMVTAAQSYGMGPFEANAVLLGWNRKPEREASYRRMVQDLVDLDRSVFLLDYKRDRSFGQHREIHIWWRGLQQNGGKMLLMSSLLTSSEHWAGAQITVITVVEDEAHRDEAQRNLQAIIDSARVDATPRVILRDGRDIADIMRSESGSADLAMIGLHLSRDAEAPFMERHNRLLSSLPTTLLVHGAEHFQSAPVLFDDDETDHG